jgi:hypothetical protein
MSALITADYFNSQMATLGLKSNFAPGADALEVLIEEASDWVEGYTDRKFALENASAYVAGPARYGQRLLLDDYPVNYITQLGYLDADNELVEIDITGVRVRTGGILEAINPVSLSFIDSRVYYVAYQRGYAVIPSNVQRAVALKIANLIQPQYQGPQEREVFMVSNLDAMIVDLLEPFRRERIG